MKIPREMLSTETAWCCILRRSQQWVRPEMDLDNDRPVRHRLPGPLNDLLEGVEHHRAGRLDRAEILYKRALWKAHNNPDCLIMHGAIAKQPCRAKRAILLL